MVLGMMVRDSLENSVRIHSSFPSEGPGGSRPEDNFKCDVQGGKRKTLGTILGVPHNKDCSILGCILWYPNLGKLPNAVTSKAFLVQASRHEHCSMLGVIYEFREIIFADPEW